MSSKKYNNRINCYKSSSSSSSSNPDYSIVYKPHSSHKKHGKVCKLLYSIGAWADNRVVEIKFVPHHGSPITWNTVNNTLNPSSPTNINHWNIQSPIISLQFPVFPLRVCNGDKFLFTFNNDASTPNAFACAANIDGNLYKTVNSTVHTSYKIVLHPPISYSIVDPSYSPTTDLATRNIIDTENYISINSSNGGDYTLIWQLSF